MDSSCKQNSQTKTPFLSQNLPATSITFRVKSKPLQRPAGIMAWDPLLSLYPSIPMATVSSGGAWVGHWFSLPLGYHSPVLACLAFLHGCYHFLWCVLKHSRTGFDQDLQQVPRRVLYGGQRLRWTLSTARLSGGFHQSCRISVQSHQEGMSGSPRSQGSC